MSPEAAFPASPTHPRCRRRSRTASSSAVQCPRWPRDPRLVGPEPTVDHHAVHIRKANEGEAQNLHGDAIIDVRPTRSTSSSAHPQDVTLGDGRHPERARQPPAPDQRVRHRPVPEPLGQTRLVCPAGTVQLLHHGIWHGGRKNDSAIDRYVQTPPNRRQVRLWNLEDLYDDQVARELDQSFPGTRTPPVGWRSTTDCCGRRSPVTTPDLSTGSPGCRTARSAGHPAQPQPARREEGDGMTAPASEAFPQTTSVSRSRSLPGLVRARLPRWVGRSTTETGETHPTTGESDERRTHRIGRIGTAGGCSRPRPLPPQPVTSTTCRSSSTSSFREARQLRPGPGSAPGPGASHRRMQTGFAS